MVSRLVSVVVLTLGFATSASSAVDLTGTYNVATLTPLERPKMFGDKRFLTQAEAEKIRREDAAAKTERNNKAIPTAVRRRPAAMALRVLLVMSAVIIRSGSTMAIKRFNSMGSSGRRF